MSQLPESIAMRSLITSIVGALAFLVVLAFGLSLTLQWALIPHRYCLMGNKLLIWGAVVSNGAIAFVYFAIPAAMVTVVRAVPEVFFSTRVVYLFAAFIVACALTHVMLVVTLFWPAYYAQLTTDGVCALVSIATLRELFRVRPELAAFVSLIHDVAKTRPFRH